MKTLPIIALSISVAMPVVAEENRQLDSHEHGVGRLDIAFDGDQVAMELHAPGADIVGFEYGAESAKDVATVEAALTLLSAPLDLFEFPQAAGCEVVKAHAELESEESHDDHAEGEHKGHDDHAEDEHEGHDDHAEEEHEGHDDHAEDKHEEHADEVGHTEFHAEYLLNCSNLGGIKGIKFAYFETFPNALEVEVQIITDAGATSFEVERAVPALDLSDLF